MSGMRVIAGEKKGHTLAAVPGRQTRPTTDKVKESIFNIIGPYFQGGRGLDLYAGTGGLGIEALSRGVSFVVFVDHHQKAVETVTRNLEHTQLRGRAAVYRNDAMRALQILIRKKERFDYIFLDPPYAKKQLSALLAIIRDFFLLQQGGLVVCEHGVDERIEAGEHWIVMREQQYGDTAVTVLQLDDDYYSGVEVLSSGTGVTS